MTGVLLCIAVCGASLTAQSTTEKAWEVIEKGLSEKSVTARIHAVTALGSIPYDERAQKNAEKLLVDASPKVRSAAALALGNMGAKSSADKIANLFDDPYFEEVIAAATALRQLGDARAYRVYYATLTGEKKTGEGMIASQLKILRDPKALAKMGFDQGIGFVPYAGPVLEAYEMIARDDTSPIRGEAALWLAHDPDPRSGQALVSALADKKYVVRAAVAEAIGQRDDPALKESLTPLFNDTEDVVRYASAASYLRLESPNLQQMVPLHEFTRQKVRWSRNEALMRHFSRLLHSF